MKILKFLKILIISAYVVSGVLLAVFLWPKSGYRALTVATSSMSPAIPQGSLVVIKNTPPRQLKSGDVVTYINPANTRQTITHRIVETRIEHDLPVLVTKGDANNAPDKKILGGNVVGRVIWHVPVVGKLINLAQQPVGLFLLVFLPGLLIIWDEIRRLRRTLSLAKVESQIDPEPLSVAPLPQKVSRPRPVPVAPQTRPKRRGMDGIALKSLIMIILLPIWMIGITRASLSSTATLTNNTISTVSASGHLLINRVFIGGTGSSLCPEGLNSISITGTGPGSTNVGTIKTTCNITINNSNTVTITNSNSQTSTSGSANSNGNTTGGGATSGSVANSNSTDTTVVIGNSSGSVFDTQWVELYNPTNQPIALGGWKLIDNSGIIRSIGSQTIAAHGFALISKADLGGIFGNGLDGAGDRLILKNPSSLAMDSISWGSDTSQLNPSITAVPAGGGIERKTLGLDTDTAADWQLIRP